MRDQTIEASCGDQGNVVVVAAAAGFHLVNAAGEWIRCGSPIFLPTIGKKAANPLRLWREIHRRVRT